jgi:hypothetical protein
MWQLAILQLAKTTGFKKAGPKQQAKHETKGSIKNRKNHVPSNVPFEIKDPTTSLTGGGIHANTHCAVPLHTHTKSLQ